MTISKANLGKVFTSVPIQPILKLVYSDYQTSVRKTIKIKVFRYTPDMLKIVTDVTKSFAANLGVPKTDSSGGSSQFYTLMTAIGQGGMLRYVNKEDEGLSFTFNYPEETADADLQFKGLKIKFESAGKYVVVFAIDGIESLPSDVITVTEVNLTIGQKIVDALDYVVLVSIALLVLVANSSHHDVWWLVVAFLGIIAGFVFVTETDDDNPFYMTLLLITLVLMFFGLLEVTYQLWKRKKDKRTNFTFLMRRDLSVEYVYQILHDRPSERWVKSE
jgi:hypothetical protein